jgi:hypothetical protein
MMGARSTRSGKTYNALYLYEGWEDPLNEKHLAKGVVRITMPGSGSRTWAYINERRNNKVYIHRYPFEKAGIEFQEGKCLLMGYAFEGWDDSDQEPCMPFKELVELCGLTVECVCPQDLPGYILKKVRLVDRDQVDAVRAEAEHRRLFRFIESSEDDVLSPY